MLETAVVPIPTKKKIPLNSNIDLKDYHLYVANHFLEFDAEACKEIFYCLVKHTEIKEIEKSPHFLMLLAKVHPVASPQEVFEQVACSLISTNSLQNLKFLLELFDLRKITTNKGSTLLHLACVHENRQEMIAHLVEKEFDVNAQNLAGSPIHDLVMFDSNASLIPIFEKKGANLNALNQNKMTPLHIVAVRQNAECMKKLFACKKVDRKLRHNGRTYLQLAEGAKQGTFHLTLPAANFTVANPAEANEALFYKMLFSDKLRQDYFKTCMTFFEKKTVLESEEQQLFFYAYILSRALTKKVIKQFVAAHVESGRVDKSIFLFLLANTTTWLIKHRPAAFEGIVNTLCEMQLDLLEKMDSCSVTTSEKMKLYVNLSSWFTAIHLLAKGKDVARRGLDAFPEGDNDLRACLFYNQGASQIQLLDSQGALKSFENAFNLNNSDNEIFVRYFSSLLSAEDYKTAKTICRTSNCPEYSKILLLSAQYQSSELSASEALKALEECVCQDALKTFLLEFQTDCHLALGNHEKAFSIAKASFSFSEAFYESKKDNNISVAMGKLLEVCLRMGKYQEGFEFLKLWQIKYPREYMCNSFLKVVRFLFCLKSENLDLADQLLQELIQSKIDSNYLCDLCINLALHQQNASKTLHYLEIALKISPDSIQANVYKELLLLLPSDKDQHDGIEASMPAEEVIVPVETDVEDQDDAENWDFKQIHAFFQDQKKKALLALEHKLLQMPQQKGVWKVGETAYQEGDLDLFSLNSPLYPDHYVVIDRNLLLDKKYRQALQKGLCERASDKDGLKVLCNTLAELKLVGENTRVYTVKIYQNGNKFLFVLDKTGNHLKIKRELKERKCLEVIDVSLVSETYRPAEVPHQDSDKPQKSCHRAAGEDPTGADSFRPVFVSPPSDDLPQNDVAKTKDLKKSSTPSSNC